MCLNVCVWPNYTFIIHARSQCVWIKNTKRKITEIRCCFIDSFDFCPIHIRNALQSDWIPSISQNVSGDTCHTWEEEGATNTVEMKNIQWFWFHTFSKFIFSVFMVKQYCVSSKYSQWMCVCEWGWVFLCVFMIEELSLLSIDPHVDCV